jgi:hypothetical protein
LFHGIRWEKARIWHKKGLPILPAVMWRELNDKRSAFESFKGKVTRWWRARRHFFIQKKRTMRSQFLWMHFAK